MKNIIEVKKINTYFDKKDDYIFFKKKSSQNQNYRKIKKILIIKWGGMGDVIQSSFAINAILAEFKFSLVDINTGPNWEIFFKNEKRINSIWSINFGIGLKKIISSLKWLILVKKNNYDLIIDLQTNDRTKIYLSILRILFNYPKFSVGNHPTYPYKIQSNHRLTIETPINIYNRTLSVLNIFPKTFNPSFEISQNDKNTINIFLKKYNVKKNHFVVFIPGSSKSNFLKRWGVDKFARLSKMIESKEIPIILIGGPDDVEDCLLLKKKNPNIINFCNKVKLTSLIELFSKAKLVIANDTGPTHLAACALVPLIQIVGPTNPIKVKPYGKDIISVQAEIECKNCYKKQCSHHSCMKGVNPEFIFNIANKYL